MIPPKENNSSSQLDPDIKEICEMQEKEFKGMIVKEAQFNAR